VVGEAIEERSGELLVTAEDLGPLAEGEVAGDGDRLLLVAVGDEVEEQLASGAVEGDEADLVDLCGAPHKSTYGDTSLMCSRPGRSRDLGALPLDDSTLLRS